MSKQYRDKYSPEINVNLSFHNRWLNALVPKLENKYSHQEKFSLSLKKNYLQMANEIGRILKSVFCCFEKPFFCI